MLKKANAHSVVIYRLIKKINIVNKNRSKRKNWFKLCLWVFSKKESYVVHISFYTTRGWNRQVIPDRAVQWSTPWVVFLWPPVKAPFVCGFSPSLLMITLNLLPLCFSKSHKYNNYGKATYIVSSNICLFTCP